MLEYYHSGEKGKIFKPKPELSLNPKWKGDVISKEYLEQLYIKEHLGIRTIAEKLSINYKVVKARLKYYQIPIRTLREARKYITYPNGKPSMRKITLEEVLQLINQGLTKTQIAVRLSVCEKSIYDILRREGIYDEVKHLIKLNAIKCNVKPHGYFSKKLGYKVRSSWEEKVAIILQENNIDYKYEPFLLPLMRTCYLPDFKVGKIIIEIKGYPFNCHDTLMEAIKTYPEYRFWLIRSNGKLEDLSKYFEHDYPLFGWHNEIIEDVKNKLISDLKGAQ